MTNTTLYLDPSWRVIDKPARGHLSHMTHVEDILNALPRYFGAMRSLKRLDPDAYDLFARIGAPFAGPDSLFNDSVLAAGFLRDLPTLRVLFLTPNLEDEAAEQAKGPDGKPSRLGFYMTRVNRPAGIEAINAPIYHVRALYHDDRMAALYGARWRTFAEDFHAAVLPNGKVRLLRQIEEVSQKLRQRHDCNVPVMLHRRAWRYPRIALDNAEHQGISPHQWAQQIVAALSSCVTDDDAIRVRAIRHDIACAFTVHKQDGSRFFADRGATADGRRQRILHYVRGHYRLTNTGESFVRPHYRGARHFTWNGCEVRLSVPDWHHAPIETLSAAGYRPDDKKAPAGLIDTPTFAGILAKNMDEPFFLSRKKLDRGGSVQ